MIINQAVVAEMPVETICSPNGVNFPVTPKSKAIVRKLQEKSNVKIGIAVEQGKAEEVKKRIAGGQVDVDEGDKENEDKGIAEEKAAHIEREIWMTERMREMELQLRMLEGVMEDNEGRFAEEMKDERKLRLKNEETTSAQVRNLMDRLNAKDRENDELRREMDRRRQTEPAKQVESSEVPRKKYQSALSISDPAGDVVCDFGNCLRLAKHLRNDKFSISTATALFDNALTRHEVLAEVLTGNDKGFSSEFVVQRFKNKFGSLYEVDSPTMSLIVILAMAKINPTKVKAGIKYAGSLRLADLKEVLPVVKKSGRIPSLASEFKLKKLTELAGIAELLSCSEDANDFAEHWSTIESLISAGVCFIKEKKTKLAAAKAKLLAFDGSKYLDCDDLLADYLFLFDVCTS